MHHFLYNEKMTLKKISLRVRKQSQNVCPMVSILIACLSPRVFFSNQETLQLSFAIAFVSNHLWSIF